MHCLTKKHLSRRTLLRGAGAAIALPLLESMAPAGVRASNVCSRDSIPAAFNWAMR